MCGGNEGDDEEREQSSQDTDSTAYHPNLQMGPTEMLRKGAREKVFFNRVERECFLTGIWSSLSRALAGVSQQVIAMPWKVLVGGGQVGTVGVQVGLLGC